MPEIRDLTPRPAARTDLAPLVDFLDARLTEDLARLWERQPPGMAAQVAVLDDLLVTLRSGVLPSSRELRVLLYGYGAHADYHATWPITCRSDLAVDRAVRSPATHAPGAR